MMSVVHVPAGEYEIGDESIPNASPRHRRRLGEFWIDARPVSWAHFEGFVAGGGFEDDALWIDAGARPTSIDQRHKQLLPREGFLRIGGVFQLASIRDLPITGLTWFEAVAVARFYGARLAFETEWEAAMSLNSGCLPTIGFLQEWAADVFTPRYWRADFESAGVPWQAGTDGEVTVRGVAPEDLYHHVSLRVGRPPDSNHPYRGFRRVWNRAPEESQIIASWKG
jgi:formylglycine-generating enzyme required for sulfatase activity